MIVFIQLKIIQAFIYLFIFIFPWKLMLCVHFLYGKCPKISYTKKSDKMAYANSADPDQNAPKYVHSIKYFKKQLHKKKI